MTLEADLDVSVPVFVRKTPLGNQYTAPRDFVGTLIVPKRLLDGRYVPVDVWRSANGGVVYITPYDASRSLPKLYIGAATYFGEPPGEGTSRGVYGTLSRVHTASGVIPEGVGFGYTLYCAAALAIRYQRSPSYVGVMSLASVEHTDTPGGNRTPDADKAWRFLTTIPLGVRTRRPPIATSDDIDVWAYLEKTASIYDDDYDPDEYESNEDGNQYVSWPGEYILTESVLDSGFVVRLGPKLEPTLNERLRIEYQEVVPKLQQAYKRVSPAVKRKLLSLETKFQDNVRLALSWEQLHRRVRQPVEYFRRLVPDAIPSADLPREPVSNVPWAKFRKLPVATLRNLAMDIDYRSIP